MAERTTAGDPELGAAMLTPFTIIRNNRGSLSKSLALYEGRLKKTAAADLVDGTATRAAVPDLSSFAKILEGLGSHEALTFGITGAEQAQLCTQEALASGRAPVGAICRARANFAWRKGRGILMLDIDRPRDGSTPLRAMDFDELLARLLPWWSKSARLYRPSASAFIYDVDGNELSGQGSLRCYAIADKAENTPFVGVAIADALWKAGHGRIEFSAAGSMLVRCPIDCAVWQPERLDFAGPAVLGPGLVKRQLPPRIIDGDDIDTDAAIAAGPGRMTVAAWASRSIEVHKAKQAARPEERTRRRNYIDERVRRDIAAGIEEVMARRKWRAAIEDHELSGSFTLHFRDQGIVTVDEVLRNPAWFDRERLADPNEPDYASDPRIAQFYANEGRARPHIFSHAHGGCKYVLTGAKREA